MGPWRERLRSCRTIAWASGPFYFEQQDKLTSNKLAFSGQPKRNTRLEIRAMKATGANNNPSASL